MDGIFQHPDPTVYQLQWVVYPVEEEVEVVVMAVPIALHSAPVRHLAESEVPEVDLVLFLSTPLFKSLRRVVVEPVLTTSSQSVVRVKPVSLLWAMVVAVDV